jgi:hypothetical protein
LASGSTPVVENLFAVHNIDTGNTFAGIAPNIWFIFVAILPEDLAVT